MRGGMVLCRQMRLKRSRVCDVILLAPWEGMGVVTCWFRISKASLVVQSPEVAGFPSQEVWFLRMDNGDLQNSLSHGCVKDVKIRDAFHWGERG